jgi:hypothetical protein
MRVLKKRGIHPRRAARKLFLSDAHANLRLEFALTFINMTEEFWENVVFCDEKTFGYGTIKSKMLEILLFNICLIIKLLDPTNVAGYSCTAEMEPDLILIMCK